MRSVYLLCGIALLACAITLFSVEARAKRNSQSQALVIEEVSLDELLDVSGISKK